MNCDGLFIHYTFYQNDSLRQSRPVTDVIHVGLVRSDDKSWLYAIIVIVITRITHIVYWSQRWLIKIGVIGGMLLKES